MTDTFVREDNMDDDDLNRQSAFTEEDKDSLNRQMNDYDKDPNDSKNLDENRDDESMMDKVNERVDEFKQRLKNDSDS